MKNMRDIMVNSVIIYIIRNFKTHNNYSHEMSSPTTTTESHL